MMPTERFKKSSRRTGAAAVLTTSLLALVLAGCAGGSAGGELAGGEDVITVGIVSDPGTFDPWAPADTGKLETFPTLYQTLVQYDSFGGEAQPLIAEKWEQVSDTVVRVTLFDGVHDTEGNLVTADDVKFSYDGAKASNNWNNRVGALDTVEVVDDLTLDFTFKSIGLTTVNDALGDIAIVSEEAYDASPDGMVTEPVGTSPYRLTDYVAGSSLTFERDEDHWQSADAATGVGEANAATVVMRVISDASQMATALETGEIDIADTVTIDQLGSFMDGDNARDGYVVHQELSNVTWNAFFNASDQSPMQDQTLRQAVAYAIDNEAIVEGVLGGRGEPDVTFGASVYGDFQSKWEDDDYYGFDPEKAKQLLSEAGYGENELTLRIMTNNESNLNKAAQIIQSGLLSVGIQSTISSYDAALFDSYQTDPSQWDIQLNGKGTSSGYLTAMWNSSFNSALYDFGNRVFVKDAELDELLATANSADGHTPENVDALHQYLKDQAYAKGLYNAYVYSVGRAPVSDIVTNAKSYVVPGAAKVTTGE